jgi:hypothetical protein
VTQKTMEAYRDRGNAQRALDALLESPVNKKSSFAYRGYIQQAITDARVLTAQRQVCGLLLVVLASSWPCPVVGLVRPGLLCSVLLHDGLHPIPEHACTRLYPVRTYCPVPPPCCTLADSSESVAPVRMHTPKTVRGESTNARHQRRCSGSVPMVGRCGWSASREVQGTATEGSLHRHQAHQPCSVGL